MEVKCNCPNRKPLWRDNVYQTYECGHRDGIIFQFWPGDLFTIGLALDGTFKEDKSRFEIFRKICNWRLYDDEYLSISRDEVILWQLEIEQLKRYLSKEEFMGWGELQKWQRFWQSNQLLYGDIEKTLEDGLKVCQASLQMDNPIEFLW